MEKKTLDFELPVVKFVNVEVEQGFAVSYADVNPGQYTLGGRGEF